MHSAFTLLELVLALALASIVLYLLMTAIELYLHRVDSSRAEVETAQLARALLDRIADDVESTRYVAPKSAASGAGMAGAGSPNTGAQTGFGASGGSNQNANANTNQSTNSNANVTAQSGQPTSGGASGGLSGGTTSLASPGNILGLYGTADELRIDRTPPISWSRPTLEEEQVLEPVLHPKDLPQTIRYFFEEGERQSAADYAKRGVSAKPRSDAAGLYRHQMPTASLPLDQSDAVTQGLLKEEADLLAPEVISIEFAYHNGTELLDQWDAVEQQGLPRGVEIRMKLLKASYDAREEEAEELASRSTGYRERDVVEYRRFVSLTPLLPQPPTPMLSGSGQQGGRGQGTAGQSGLGQGGAGQGASQSGSGQNN